MLSQAGASIFSKFNIGEGSVIAKYINTGMTLLFNTIFIPTLIEVLIVFESFDTKSDR